MHRATLAALAIRILVPGTALAADPVPDQALPGGAPAPATPAHFGRTSADPWSTRGTFSLLGGLEGWNVDLPLPGLTTPNQGTSQAAGIDFVADGKKLAFELALQGNATPNIQSSGPDARQGLFSGYSSMGLVLANSDGFFISVGPAIEARVTAVGSGSQGGQAASWQTVVAGPSARLRLFAGPHLFVTGSAFAGVVPLSGSWDVANQASLGGFLGGSSGNVVQSGTVSQSYVVGGTAALSLRPSEALALTGGISSRAARYQFDGAGSAFESAITPFVGLELLY